MSIIKLKGVSKFYYSKKNVTSGFSKINLELNAGEFVVITGESGSGKSTLLNVISGLDTYEEGEIYINGSETSHYMEEDYENYRRKYIGNIFQKFNLVNSYTVYQNIELVLLLNGYKKKEIKKKVLDVIKTVGLTKYKNTKASKLSGGQKQRVAIARALIKDTPIIVADEPTGNLDIKSAEAIMKLLYDISKEKLVVIVTHNYEQVEKYATRKITMHDGKIILDKKIKKTDEIELQPSEYKNIKPIYKCFLALRNAFNIKTKFMLLMIVYLVLTLFVFSSYSSLKKIDYDNSNLGYHPLFNDRSSNRVILNKKDKSAFNNEDFAKIEKIKNIKNIVKDDLVLDQFYSLNNDKYYYYTKIRSINEIKKLKDGKMPINDKEIVLGLSEYDWYEQDIFENNLNLSTDNGTNIGDFKVSGVVKLKNEYDTIIYVNDEVFNKIRKYININYSDVYLTLNNNIYKYNNDERLYYQIFPSDKVSEGTALVSDSLNSYCKGELCLNKEINIKVKNLYYEDNINLNIKRIYSMNSFSKKTGINKDRYDEYSNAIFISNSDYDKLFQKDTYQISLFIDDMKNSKDTIEEINKLDYNVYYMKDMMKEANGTVNSVLKVVREILFIIAIIVLFFISYFIIKIILKSRNTYFSTIRTLGATKRISRSLLNIELFIDINFVYLLFILFINLVKKGIIKNSYILDITTYFKLNDYIIIYLVLITMSLLISLRYARKLFKDSVMQSFREEV